MALKQSYQTKDEIPTELQSFYVQKGSLFELQVEGIETITGIAAKNAELLDKVATHPTAMAAKDAEINNLKRTQADATTLPAGHVAVPKADAKYIEELKPLGKPDEIKTKVAEHGTLTTEIESRKRGDLLTEAAQASGYNPEAFKTLAEAKGLNIEVREVDDGKGKKAKRAFVTVKENDKDVEKPLVDYVDQTSDLKVFLPSLKPQPSGTRMIAQDPGGKAAGANDFDDIRGEMKDNQKTKQPKDSASVLAALGGQPSPVATA